MPNNLANKTNESAVKLYDWPSTPVCVDHLKRIKEIKSTIDALLDIRLSLSVKKIISPTIKRSELQEIVTKVKEKEKDLKVRQEIDKVFVEYLDSEKIPVSDLQNKLDDNITDKTLSLNGMKQDLQSGGVGSAKTLSDAHYKITTTPLTTTPWQ